MSDEPPKYEVGRGRPPKHAQWAKGQSGNPNRIDKRAPKTALELIDKFFADDIDVVENGVSRRVSSFEAIVLQLCIKATAGASSPKLRMVATGLTTDIGRYWGRMGRQRLTQSNRLPPSIDALQKFHSITSLALAKAKRHPS